MTLLHRLKSIRSVLTLWYAGVLLIAFAVFGNGLYFYLDYRLKQALQQEMAAEVEWIMERVHQADLENTLNELPSEVRQVIENHLQRDGDNYTVILAAPDGRLLYLNGDDTIDDYLAAPAVRDQLIHASFRRDKADLVRVTSLSRGSFVLHVALPGEEIKEMLAQTFKVLRILAVLALLVSVAGGWTLSGVVLRPINQIIDVAERRTTENLGERIPEREVDDELGRLIKTLNRTADRMQNAYEQIRQFSSNVAHELMTPLTILRGEAELALSRGVNPEQAMELATTYLEETIRISVIVEDLLTLARAESGRLQLENVPIRVDGLIDEIYEDAQILAADKGLTVELLENAPATVRGDKTRLRRLFRSLLSNAVRYTDNGGSIRIQSRLEADRLLVSVEDTGIGIPAASLPKIFDRFYRVDAARSRDAGGSGLGLSLAKWIVESHGGAISVRSRLGTGTVFTVSLPPVADLSA